MADGSEASVEVLRAQYSIDSAYGESREGLSQLSHLTPVKGKNNRFNRKLSPNSSFVLCRSIIFPV